jgi:hypothetical protein
LLPSILLTRRIDRKQLNLGDFLERKLLVDGYPILLISD